MLKTSIPSSKGLARLTSASRGKSNTNFNTKQQ